MSKIQTRQIKNIFSQENMKMAKELKNIKVAQEEEEDDDDDDDDDHVAFEG